MWQRDAWLELFGSFVSEDTGGKAVTKIKPHERRWLFPRFHQWHAVRTTSAHVRGHGPGHNYLLQHSTGSGKSNTIAWLASTLATLHTPADGSEVGPGAMKVGLGPDQPVFSKVVIVTDRVVLDRQLQDTVSGFDHTPGTIQKIDQNSAQLREALESAKARIVITTLQKFPIVAEQATKLAGARFAVIADEAHSSQAGEAAKDLKSVLTGLTGEQALKAAEAAESEQEQDPQDRLAEAARARGKQANLSFFAFTATPKQKTLEMFGERVHLRALRRRARSGPVESGPFMQAKQSTTVAAQFLTWLAERDRTLEGCTQHDIDAWYGSGPSTRRLVDRFLYWCRANRLIDQLDVPRHKCDDRHLIGEHDRLRIIRHLLTDDGIPDAYRIAGCLLTVYGQPVTRIVTMTIDDLRIEADSVQIRPARDWLDVPAPLAVVIKRHLDNRTSTSTTANAHTQWLFPGYMPGRHIRRESMGKALRDHGVPALAAKNTTWQQLVRHAPPQVVAQALGISPKTALDYADRAGADWMRYAADRSSDRE